MSKKLHNTRSARGAQLIYFPWEARPKGELERHVWFPLTEGTIAIGVRHDIRDVVESGMPLPVVRQLRCPVSYCSFSWSGSFIRLIYSFMTRPEIVVYSKGHGMLAVFLSNSHRWWSLNVCKARTPLIRGYRCDHATVISLAKNVRKRGSQNPAYSKYSLMKICGSRASIYWIFYLMVMFHFRNCRLARA